MIRADTELVRADLEIKDVVQLPDGRFDCMISHPKYGWIPFTASQDDVEEHGRLIWQKLNTEFS